MRELNVNEIKAVSGGGFFRDYLMGKLIDYTAGYAWSNREAAGRWAYNGGRFRRSMY
ncbi:hypothetical protein [Colwellia demingiae]|uniref:hypothetical protein n=1 Tax=Colwellia demingiae TaxID=89401 RepID=UPI0014788FC3|nr:hypothetical protein [Colwellia demingiae]